MTDSPSSHPRTFAGTHVREDASGSALVAHTLGLTVVSGCDRGARHQLEGSRMLIGSAGHCDLVLRDPMISRRHCEIHARDQGYVIRDLDSTNGTRVNDTPIVEAYLTPGARVRLGDTELLFEPRKKWQSLPEVQIDHFGELYGQSTAMRAVFAMLDKVAQTDLSCLLVGETGTGKELAAQALHQRSHRKHKNFVVVDCGAISENLTESELFGHEKGAFTGADRQRAGAFELADGGTIFLDEIGELPLHLQPKLLRALERREVKRLGASRSLDVDVRVVAATHRDLLQMVAQGEFREDLYYRLAEVVVALPPLRERREDVPLLARRIMQAHAPRGCKVQHIEDSAMQALQMRDWLGNVRELRNVLRRALALSSGPTLRAADVGRLLTRPSRLPPAPGGGDATGSTEVGEHLPIKEARERWLGPLEREYLTRVVRDSAGNLDRAAERAGIHRKSLERLLRQHGLKVAELRASPMPSQEKSR